MKMLSIGEVARRTGLRPSALRYYEEAGILPEPARVSGQRRYDVSVVRHIDVLQFAQQSGFTLGEIKTLFHGFASETPLSARWKALARTKLQELDLRAKRIRRMRRALMRSLQCGCVRIEDCRLSRADADAKTKGAKASGVRAC